MEKPKTEKTAGEAPLPSLACSRSDTPETDALLLKINEGRVYRDEGPIQEHARKLERERDHVRSAIINALRFIEDIDELSPRGMVELEKILSENVERTNREQDQQPQGE